MIDETGRWDRLTERQGDMLGEAASGRAVTRTIRVSPNGDNSDGLSWRTAINSISDALDMCSTDVNELTQIRIAPQTGDVHYNIDRTGDPSWAANVMLVGSHRTWDKIMNDHDGATSIMTLTGYASLQDLNFNLGTSNNGVIIAKGAFRLKAVQFVGEDLTSAATALHLDGATTLKHGKVLDSYFKGHTTYMTAIKLDNCALSVFKDIFVHQCLKGLHIDDDGTYNSDYNSFYDTEICRCSHVDGVAIDIDAGDVQHFENVCMRGNTLNVDDVPRNHAWNAIHGSFPITIEPITIPNYDGVQVDAGEDAYGSDTEIRAAATSTKPFKIVGYRFEPSEEKKFMLRFSADSGSTWFDMSMIEIKKNKAQGASEGTDFIFNAGTRISCSAGCEVAGKNVKVWLEIQEI